MPQFYFPGGKPVSAEVREEALAKIDELFRTSPDGLAVPAVRDLVKEVLGYTLLHSFHCLTALACLPADTKLTRAHDITNIPGYICGIA